MLLKKIVFYVMVIFYLAAGVNHFVNPSNYLSIIPPYFPQPVVLNFLSGIFEVALAILLIPIKSRKLAAYGIILMLIAFMPVHIFMIEKANTSNFLLGKHTITPLIAWIRIPFQIAFIYWAYWCSKVKF